MLTPTDQYCLLHERGGMMDGIRKYLLLVTAAAVACAMVSTLMGKKGGTAAVIKMLCGLFLTFCVISPIVNLERIDFSMFTDSLSENAALAASSGETMAADAIGDIIKTRTQAYILDKAASMDLDIAVEVILDSANPPQPCAVVIQGAVSPYAKEVMSQYIADNLAIAKEDQQWS